MNESETIEEEVYEFGETTFCYNNNGLRTRSSRVLITSRQADILRLLAKNIGNVVSKEMIQEAVWGTVSYANSLAVMFTCGQPRKKNRQTCYRREREKRQKREGTT